MSIVAQPQPKACIDQIMHAAIIQEGLFFVLATVCTIGRCITVLAACTGYPSPDRSSQSFAPLKKRLALGIQSRWCKTLAGRREARGRKPRA